MKSQQNLAKALKWLCLIWLLLLIIPSVQVFNKGLHFNTDLSVLLPETFGLQPEIKSLTKKIDKDFDALSRGQLVFMLKGKDSALVDESTMVLRQRLCGLSSIFHCTDNESTSDVIAPIANSRVYLLAKSDREQLNNPDQLIERQQLRLFGLSLSHRYLPFQDDPFGFFSDSINETLSKVAPFESRGDYYRLPADKDAQQVAFFSIQLKKMGLSNQEKAQQKIEQALKAIQADYPLVSVYHSGALFHSVKSAHQAKMEMSWISGLSILGIVLLFVLSGLGISSLLGTVLVLGVSFAVALVWVACLFQSVHVLTLVFGASLLGIGVDYAIHLFCYRKAGPLGKVFFKALLVSALSTIIAFSLLSESGLIVLQQIAVFSAAGLITVFLLVVSVLAVWPFTRSALFSLLWLDQVLITLRKFRLGITSVLLLMIGVSLWLLATQFQSQTDIKSLISLNEQLLLHEKQVHQTLKLPGFNQYFIVTAKNEDQLLNRIHQLSQQLDDVKAKGAITGQLSLLDWMPTYEEQNQNRAAQLSFLKVNLPKLYTTLGVNADAEKLRKALESQALLTPGILTDHLSGVYSMLFGEVGNKGLYSLVLVKGLTDASVLASLDLPPSVFFIDKIANWSDALTHQQGVVHKQLLWIFMALGVLLILLYRQISALVIVLIPLLSCLFTYALLLGLGFQLNIFHSFALFLIIGLGMDYGVFTYSEKKYAQQNKTRQSSIALKAVFLSVLTTLLAFGLLSLSQTPLISAIGLTILIGVIFNALLTLMMKVILDG